MEQPRVSYSRSLPIRYSVDVLVAGGGPAGIAAGLAAARAGASVLLIEQTAMLGGMGTSGLVPGFCPFSDGKRIIVGGIGKEIVDRLRAAGGTGPDDRPDRWHGIPFKVEHLKMLYDEMLCEAGVTVRYCTTLTDAIRERKRVKHVIACGRQGPYAIHAQTVVDATGDGFLSVLAGADHRIGGKNGELQPPTLCSIFANVDWKAYYDFRKKGKPGNAVHETLERAIDEGFFSTPDRHHPGAYRTGDRLAGMNVGHVHGTNAVIDEQLTKAIMKGRRVVQENLAFYRKYIPGFEHVELATTGSLLGVRETRRIVADYMLTADDFLARRSFPDQIGRYNYAIDIHPSAPTKKDYEAFLKEFRQQFRYKSGESYGIPLRSLIVRGLTNAMVAGRCMGTDRKMQGSTRVMPCCFITGQAAGMTAAMATDKDGAVREVQPDHVIDRLRDTGAYIPDPGRAS